MLTRLIQNWPYKLAALVIAVALRAYVSHINDPRTNRQVTIPITLIGVPESLVVTDYPQSVALTVNGPASSLESVTNASFVATVSLRSARAGMNQALPIQITPAPGTPQDVMVENQSPRTAVVTLENELSLRMPIRASFDRIAPAGLSYGTPSVTPQLATVEGPESIVHRVAKLVVHGEDAVGNESISSNVLDGSGTVQALDAQQVVVTGVTIRPDQVDVRVPVMRESATKELIVNAAVAGSPAYPTQVTSVEVQPSRVTATGPPAKLARTSVVDTAAVDITGATGDVTKTVAINLPAGLTAGAGHPTAIVTVHISPASASSPLPSKTPAVPPGQPGSMPAAAIPPATH